MKAQPNEFICKCGHEFVSPKTIGEEHSEAEVSPCCHSTNFILLSELTELMFSPERSDVTQAAISDVIVTEHCLKAEAPVKDAVIFDMLDWCEKKLNLSNEQKTFLSERFDHVFEMGKGIGRLEILQDELDRIKN